METIDVNNSPTPLEMDKLIPLVTGGGSGIGLGLVKEFIKRGSPKVLITGRRENVLQQAVEEVGADKLVYKVSDAEKASDRQELFDWVKTNHPDCNVLVNNAGIQRRVPPATDTADWETRAQEIEINFAAPIHLTTLFAPYFVSKNETCVIANVTSGLAFVPLPVGPVYSATKAGLHNFNMAFRYSLEDSKVKLVEIVPPAVKSNLGGSHDFGEELDEYCADAMERFAKGELEFGYKFSDAGRMADRATIEKLSRGLGDNFKVPKF